MLVSICKYYYFESNLYGFKKGMVLRKDKLLEC